MKRTVTLLHERLITAAGGIITFPENDPEFWSRCLSIMLRINQTPTTTGSPTSHSLSMVLQKGSHDAQGNIYTGIRWVDFAAKDYAQSVQGGENFYGDAHVAAAGLLYDQTDSSSAQIWRHMIPGCFPTRVRGKLTAAVAGGTSPTVSYNVTALAELRD